MRRWSISLGLVAGTLVSLGTLLSSASGQSPPPQAGALGMPPAGSVGGTPPGFDLPPGAFANKPNAGAPCPTPDFPNVAPPCQESASPFSCMPQCVPSAFCEGEDPCLYQVRWHVSAGYSFLWFRQGNLPPLATTGSVADPFPGALNQPNTMVLSQSREPGNSAALRVNGTYWCLPEILSLDANFLIMEQRSFNQAIASNANGEPLLARPFFSPITGRQEADLRALPGIFQGSLFDTITTRLMGGEINLNWHNSYNCQGASLSLLSGVRWLRLDERYSSFDTSTDLGGGGISATFSDTFSTYNQFLGGQLGLDLRCKLSRATLSVTGKVALGNNYQTINVGGQTVISDLTTGAVVADAQGLYAQPSNVGTYRRSRFAVLPEVESKISFDITDWLRFNVGYTFFYLNDTVRPGDQIDPTVNIQPLQAGGGAAPFLPGPPPFRQSSFSVHMVNLALEFLF